MAHENPMPAGGTEAQDALKKKPSRKAGRRERVSFGEHRAKLHVRGLPPDVVGRWVNDTGGRIEEMQERGYQFVGKDNVLIGEGPEDGNQAIDTRVTKIVGRDESGQPLRAYLMATKKEFYDEDQAAKNAELDAVDSAIKHGQHGKNPGDGRYIPSPGIKVSGYKP